MSVPAVAVVGALFVMEWSVTSWAVVVAVAKLLSWFVSSVALLAALLSFPTRRSSDLGLMCTVMVKGWVALGASVPKVQVTVPAVLVHPALAETKDRWSGSTSASERPMEDEGPTLVTDRV